MSQNLTTKLGLTAISILTAGNLFFVRGLIDSIETSSRAVTVLQSQFEALQKSMVGLTDLRIEVVILKTKMDEMNNNFKKGSPK